MPTGEPGFEGGLAEGEGWDPSFIERYAHSPNLHLIAVAALLRIEDGGGPAFRRMTPGQQALVSTFFVEGHVQQGGFGKLWAYGPWAIGPAIKGYRLFKAGTVAELLERVIASADWSHAARGGVPTADESERLDAFDREEDLACGCDLGDLKKVYIKTHPEEFPER